MNEQFALFLAGLIVGILASGFVVYEFEETRYLSLENSYQEAVTQAQNKVIVQDKASNAVNANIGDAYAKTISDAISQYNAGGLPKANSSSMPLISHTASSPNAATRKCAVNLQLCKIEVNDWQNWYRQQAGIYK